MSSVSSFWRWCDSPANLSPIAVSALFSWGLFSGVALQAYLSPPAYRTGTPAYLQELTAEEHSRWLLTGRTRPARIVLNILSEEEFNRRRPAPRVAGWAAISRDPCEVYVKAGAEVMLMPQDGDARWMDPESGNTLVHEIMHCLRGSWYRGWTNQELGIVERPHE